MYQSRILSQSCIGVLHKCFPPDLGFFEFYNIYASAHSLSHHPHTHQPLMVAILTYLFMSVCIVARLVIIVT